MNRVSKGITCVVMALAGLAAVRMVESQDSMRFVAGAGACAACHRKTFDRWSDSIHGRMIQPATPRAVVSRPEMSGGPSGRRFWRDGVFFIQESGKQNRVDLTLGNRRIQHYLSYKGNGQIIV